MKEKFDLVIEELSLYFEISHDSGEAAVIELCVGKELSPSEEYVSASRFSDRPRSPAAGPPRDTSMGDDEGTLKTSRAEPEKACAAEGLDSEQEVPVDCSLLSEGEELMYSSVKQKEPREAEQRGRSWDPAFMFLSCLDQFNTRKPEQNQRLEPLKTCSRPIRVGLSKKAKTKQLHPYK
ncbi:RAD51-associated protein 2-like isoform X2 [Osmerus eperlanus]|uniref:RAD51-associated protein 2-like isoform X2 n=1 Tax=Osmerus eperlanus TaxID=29151 RepID=UPI002E15F962